MITWLTEIKTIQELRALEPNHSDWNLEVRLKTSKMVSDCTYVIASSLCFFKSLMPTSSPSVYKENMLAVSTFVWRDAILWNSNEMFVYTANANHLGIRKDNP